MKKRSLKDCRTTDQVCELPRDHSDAGDFWIISDGHTVSMAQQKYGESSTQSISIPRATFNRLIAFYTKPQNVRKPCK